MPYKDPEEQMAYQRRWVAARRAGWLEENGPCIRCGDWSNLETDHIDPSRKISHNVWSWSLARRDAELEKCQVLCVSCHREKTAEARRNSTPHGKEVMYRKYRCRCRRCKEWKRLKSAKEYQRRKRSVAP